MQRRTALSLLSALVVVGCADHELAGPAESAELSPSFASGVGSAGAVYVLTNQAAGNEVLVFGRSADGTLGSPASYATGGTGTGSGLGSQGALVLAGSRWLLAVNAGSDDVSVFRVEHGGLTLTDRVASGGDMPISVTAHGSLVYVLNAAGPENISGFRLSPHGELTAIAGSTRPLSGAGVGPAQVQFTPDGDQLVVTEKATNQIVTYAVGPDGSATGPVVHASSGMTPFGFAFAGRDFLIVSEAFGGAADASAASSYAIGHGGFGLISGTVGTTETAACWTVATTNAKFAYVTNTGSGTVTGYAVGRDGRLTILDADGVTGVTGAGSAPADAAFSVNDRFLYTRNGGNGTVSAFAVGSDGSLSPIAGASGLPAGAVGLAAH